MKLPNITIDDRAERFRISVNGLIVSAHNTLGGAWKHIAWMHRVAGQKFTVGKKEIPVEQWIDGMEKAGMLD